MKRTVLAIFLIAVLFGGCRDVARHVSTVDFIVASDMGRRGVSEQKNIADLMGRFVEQNKIDFVAVAGDPIHDDGVQSTDDEEWKLKIEDVYTASSLHAIPWYVISGNHEYNGNVQAVLDYSNISKRWNAPARYYSMEYPVGREQKALLIFMDTTPLIDKYRIDEPRSDAPEQNMEQQLRWLDSTLVASKSRWKIVIGHHPVYADSEKDESERTDMQKRVGKILENRGADFYIGGHIHNFQHIKPEGKNVHYIVNSSASLSRPVNPIEGTVFCNPDPGYSVFSVSADSVRFCFMNHTGEKVYRKAVGKM